MIKNIKYIVFIFACYSFFTNCALKDRVHPKERLSILLEDLSQSDKGVISERLSILIKELNKSYKAPVSKDKIIELLLKTLAHEITTSLQPWFVHKKYYNKKFYNIGQEVIVPSCWMINNFTQDYSDMYDLIPESDYHVKIDLLYRWQLIDKIMKDIKQCLYFSLLKNLKLDNKFDESKSMQDIIKNNVQKGSEYSLETTWTSPSPTFNRQIIPYNFEEILSKHGYTIWTKELTLCSSKTCYYLSEQTLLVINFSLYCLFSYCTSSRNEDFKTTLMNLEKYGFANRQLMYDILFNSPHIRNAYRNDNGLLSADLKFLYNPEVAVKVKYRNALRNTLSLF